DQQHQLPDGWSNNRDHHEYHEDQRHGFSHLASTESVAHHRHSDDTCCCCAHTLQEPHRQQCFEGCHKGSCERRQKVDPQTEKHGAAATKSVRCRAIGQ